MKTIFLCDSESALRWVYATDTIERLQRLTGVCDKVYTKSDVMASPAEFADTEIVFSTWGMPTFTEDEIRSVFPSLYSSICLKPSSPSSSITT